MNKRLDPCYGIIPIRYASTRLPGKPLKDIDGKPMFWHVYKRAEQSNVFTSVVLATDSEHIFSVAKEYDMPCIMTGSDHVSGTDRVHEAAEILGLGSNTIVVNIQGDEPLLSPKAVVQLVDVFNDPAVEVATLATEITDEQASASSQVKVVVSLSGNALYFSRAKIPCSIDIVPYSYLGHIGIYAFRMEALRRFVKLPASQLEQKEKLEQLRMVENNIPIKIVYTEYMSKGVDTEEDLDAVRRIMAQDIEGV